MISGLENDALQGFIDETNESLLGIETAFIELEKSPGNMEIINRIFRPVHSMKGNSGFFGLRNINKFAHRLEDMLDLIRNGEIVVVPVIVDTLLTGVDYLKQMLDRVERDPSDVEMRHDEEQFLNDRVISRQPVTVQGSIAGILELAKLLEEA